MFIRGHSREVSFNRERERERESERARQTERQRQATLKQPERRGIRAIGWNSQFVHVNCWRQLPHKFLSPLVGKCLDWSSGPKVVNPATPDFRVPCAPALQIPLHIPTCLDRKGSRCLIGFNARCLSGHIAFLNVASLGRAVLNTRKATH